MVSKPLTILPKIPMDHLTKSEQQLMNIFWDSKSPLTSVDIVNMEIKDTWGSGFVSNLLRSLLKKGFLKEVGSKHYTTQYAREFAPSFTREEYAIKSIHKIAGKKLSLSQVVVGLTKEEDDVQDVIEELERIVEELKEHE